MSFFKYMAKEGKKALIYSFIIFLATLFLIPSLFLKLLTATLFIFFLYIYLILPTKNEFQKKGAIYSIVDGQVVDIKDMGNEKAVKIYSSLLDNSAIRSPFDGIIKDIKKRHGLFLKLSSKKSDKLNEKFSFVLKNEKTDLKISAISDKMGFFGFNIYKNDSLKVEFGEIIGYASNALFEIILPKNVELKVKVGDQVVGGINIIGYIKGEVE